jgi:hypothetical protein
MMMKLGILNLGVNKTGILHSPRIADARRRLKEIATVVIHFCVVFFSFAGDLGIGLLGFFHGPIEHHSEMAMTMITSV